MIRVHKVALDPNDRQATLLAKSAGVSRFAWNWALAEWKRQYEAGQKPKEAALRRQLNACKRDDFPWMLEVSKAVPQQAIKNLGAAFGRFFKGEARYPRFKQKGKAEDRFRADNGPGTVEAAGRTVRLPKIGRVRMRERVRFAGTIKSAVVSRTADSPSRVLLTRAASRSDFPSPDGKWFVSLAVDTEDTPKVAMPKDPESQGAERVVGVDLGIKALATLSDGTPPVPAPRPLRAALKKLKRLSRALARKRKGSANRQKAALALARLHRRIADLRRDALHQLTTDLVRRFEVIVVEDLNVRGMLANDRLARHIADLGFCEFRRQLEYKAALADRRVVVAERWFASSKTCSGCGGIHAGLTLADREWTCTHCGARHDRDRNAAVNLRNLAASSAVAACGEEGAGGGLVPAVEPASVKQEPDIGPAYA